MAHTVVVGSSPSAKITGRKADILLAAHYASEAALRLMKPGTEVRNEFFQLACGNMLICSV